MAQLGPFQEFLDDLATTARSHPLVKGLVAFGSTADGTRRDEWSDHDFALLTTPGAEGNFRHDLSWLPHAEEIVLSVVEHHGGVKAIYRNGHRIEFGIADIDAFSLWAGAPAEVIVGGSDVRAATATVVGHRPLGDTDPARDIRLMLTQVHAGVGRARRGEILSGSNLVRGEAVDHLLRAAAARLAGDTTRLDPLDPRRRFDRTFVKFGVRIEEAMRLPVEEAARAILDLAEDQLASGWIDFPHAGLATIREYFDWS